MAEESDSWTKWWWLGYFGVQAWTVEERRVRMALGMTMLLVIIVVYFIIVGIFLLLGVERHLTAILAGLLSLVPGFFCRGRSQRCCTPISCDSLI